MRLLVIGEINTGISTAAKIAMSQGAKVSYSQSIEDALTHLRQGKGADLAIIDVKFDVELFIKSLSDEHINLIVVACGVENNAKDAVKAIRAGAQEYLPLPPDEKLISAIFSAITDNNKPIFCKSPSMQEAISIADRVATSDANILLTGESGTGKEVMAGYIHNNSLRKDKAFIRVNCAAIPDNLLESELFGHEKGAFTGAVAKRVGKFEESDGGTLLLDEISEIDIRLQAKLLRAIQEREIDRVGGTKPVKVNLRIIATSNRNLEEEVKAGNFREDLYFRLNTINIEIPSLRERKDDIKDLAQFFIDKYAKNNNLSSKKLSPAALEVILEHKWPGNIRELENTMHRAILLAQQEQIQIEDLKIKQQSPNSSNLTLAEIEKKTIIETLNNCLGDTNHAANILGISIAHLKDKLAKLNIDQESKSQTKEKV